MKPRSMNELSEITPIYVEYFDPNKGATTMTAKHTPGKWSVKDDRGVTSIIADDGKTIASFYRVHTGRNYHNARLIAAAPELLAALRDVIGMHDFTLLDLGIGTKSLDGNKLLNARALLDRIEGK